MMKNLLFIGSLVLITNLCDSQDFQYDPFAHLSRQYSEDSFNISSINIEQIHDQLQTVNLAKLFQNFNTVSDEAACLTALLKLFAPVLAIKHWTPEAILNLLSQPVGKVLDSWGKPPSHILSGNLVWLGAYDECVAVDDMKYCSSSMALGGKYPGRFGFCFPKICSANDLSPIIALLNNQTKGALVFGKDLTCEKENSYDGVTKFAFVVCGLLLALSLMGTCYDVIKKLRKTPYNNLTEEDNHINQNGDVSVLSSSVSKSELPKEDSVETMRVNGPNQKFSVIHDFLMAFSIPKNITAILSTESPKGAIGSINGIRVLSITWVLIGHGYVFGASVFRFDNILPVSNELMHSFAFMAISNATFSVDSFFLLSGLLVGYLTIRRLDKLPMTTSKLIALFAKSNLHRYIRLTPSLMFVMLIWSSFYPRMITGPNKMFFQDSSNWNKNCEKYWWSNILYINNFWPTDFNAECIAWVWYLANDMQFYILSPFILVPMLILERRFTNSAISKRLFPILYIGAWTCVSLIITAIIYQVYNLPAIGQNPKRASSNEGQNKVYGKPYTRITPYLVGIVLGYLFSRRLFVNDKMKKAFVFFGWVCAFIIGLLVIYGPYWKAVQPGATFFNDFQRTMYGTFMRFAWAVALAWVVYACHNGSGGFIDSFLSWKVWIPLSRLTYGVYLLHILVIYYFFASRETVFHYQHNLFAFDLVSMTFVSFVCSFMMALFLEYPVLNLEKRFLM